MKLVKYQPTRLARPFGGIFDLGSELDRFFGIPTVNRSVNERAYAPAIDVREDEEALTVRADLPGLDEKDVKITILENVLTIEGERKSETETKEEGCLHTERVYGSFKRSLRLPSEVKAPDAKATFTNGVLEITLPKVEEQKPKKIDIKVK